MSGFMRYNHAGIDAHSVAIGGSSRSINSILEDFRSELAVLEAGWEGDGAASYMLLKRQWDEAAAGLNQTLATIGQVVGTGNQDMGATDRAVAGNF